MKKYILIFSLLLASYSYGQKIDTVKNALLIQPVVANTFKSDTAYQITWSVNVFRGKGVDCQAYVVFHDRFGNKIQDTNVMIPSKIIEVWLDDKIIDDFILTRFKLKRK